MTDHFKRSPIVGSGAIVVSLLSQNVGAVFAKSLFPVFGATGVATIRVALAAVILVLLIRPWRLRLSRETLPSLAGYGVALGLMNLFIYEAFARIPVGIALAIEVTGPLLIAITSSRKVMDFAWPTLAFFGLAFLLLPGDHSPALDLIGVGFAAAAAFCWAVYILMGKKVSKIPNGTSVAWGMVIASCVTLPFGASSALVEVNSALLLSILLVAVLSSALPYSLEMFALERLPSSTIGVLLSTAPAVGALAALVVLGERLALTQWAAISLIVLASIGSAVAAAKASRAPRTTPQPE